MLQKTTSLESWAEKLATGQITSVALTEQMLARAQDRRGQGHVVYTRLFVHEAMAQAVASDALIGAGLARSPLEGLPISVKDLFDIKGLATQAGSVVLKDAKPADQDAVIVKHLRQAGAIVIGTTNMTEFAYSGLGINPHHGTPVSPWDRDTGRIPGGSSSGAAVSVADAMAVAAIGTDTGGSVRIPAACCELTGFKPTASRVDMTGALPLATHLDSIGPLAHTVTDCIWLDAILAGEPIPKLKPTNPEDMVLGLPEQLILEGADETVKQVFAQACERLKAAGVQIQRIDMPELNELAHINAAGGFTAAEAWAWHRDLLREHQAQYDPRVAVRIRRGEAIQARDYMELLAARADWIARVTRKIACVDALVMPTLPVVPPAVAPLVADEALYASTNVLMLRNCSVVNFLNGCALSMPCHQTGQAPVSLMLAGGAGQDRKILRLGLTVESILRGFRQG
jgi:aspartyl-tRNA(Asn)/glutamyl-tRNA(Gln) amidotransferase subunit A